MMGHAVVGHCWWHVVIVVFGDAVPFCCWYQSSCCCSGMLLMLLLLLVMLYHVVADAVVHCCYWESCWCSGMLLTLGCVVDARPCCRYEGVLLLYSAMPCCCCSWDVKRWSWRTPWSRSRSLSWTACGRGWTSWSLRRGVCVCVCACARVQNMLSVYNLHIARSS